MDRSFTSRTSTHSQLPKKAGNYFELAKFNSPFHDWLFSSRIKDVRIFLIIACVCTLAFMPLDGFATSPSQQEGLLGARFVYLVILLIMLWVTYINPRPAAYATAYAILFVSGGVVFIVQLGETPAALFYKAAGLAFCALFIQAGPVLTTTYSLPSMLTLAFAFQVNMNNINSLHSTSATIFLWSLVLILGFASYIRDRRNLAIFRDIHSLEASDLEMKKWIALIGRLLRHEVSNQTVALNSSITLFDETNTTPTTEQTRLIKKNIHQHNILLSQLSRAAELADFDPDTEQNQDINALFAEIGQNTSSSQSEVKVVIDTADDWNERVNTRAVAIAFEFIFDTVFELAQYSPEDHPVFVELDKGEIKASIAAENAHANSANDLQLARQLEVIREQFAWSCAVEVLEAQRLILAINYQMGTYTITINNRKDESH